MIRLMAAYHEDLLVDTHLHLAKVCMQLTMGMADMVVIGTGVRRSLEASRTTLH